MNWKATKCPIWDVIAKERDVTDFDGRYYISPKAGGRYSLSGSALAVLSGIDEGSEKDALRRKISRWIFERQDLPGYPRIDSDVISAISSYNPLSPLQKSVHLLRLLNKWNDTLDKASLFWTGGSDQRVEIDLACAACEFNYRGELESYLEYLERKGWVETKIDSGDGSGFVWLTVEGAEEASRVRDEPLNDKAFIAMWFSSEVADAYDLGIEPAVRAAGYDPVRIDRKEHNNKIDDEIIAEIRSSRFLIADFTCGIIDVQGEKNSIPRGGVYYEAGFAAGLGIPVIWSVREDQIGDVHFDTRQYNHITWADAGDLKTKLENRIKATIGKFAG